MCMFHLTMENPMAHTYRSHGEMRLGIIIFTLLLQHWQYQHCRSLLFVRILISVRFLIHFLLVIWYLFKKPNKKNHPPPPPQKKKQPKKPKPAIGVIKMIKNSDMIASSVLYSILTNVHSILPKSCSNNRITILHLWHAVGLLTRRDRARGGRLVLLMKSLLRTTLLKGASERRARNLYNCYRTYI